MEIDLTNILEQPTVKRPEHQETAASPEDYDLSGLEFEKIPEPAEPVEAEEIPTAEIEVYNPEENAELLVEFIDLANVQSLTPLARWKLAKKRGGKKEITKMQLLYEKFLNDEKLTETEKRRVETYQLYLKEKEALEDAIPYTDEEKETLTKAAIPYMKSSKIKMGGGAAFWVQLSMIQGSRIIQVLTA